MKTEELIAKYPKIFQTYEGNPGNVNWYGVPGGWLPIVDLLCGAIQSYCDSTRSVENPDYEEALPYDRKDTRTHKCLQETREQVVCIQMKEKFGGLRFYTNGHDDLVEGMIRMAEKICSETCETCGTREGLGFTTGWITVRCEECANQAGKSWMSREDWKNRFNALNNEQ
jgi:hypothetical protein